jgi:hypothetical protein
MIQRLTFYNAFQQTQQLPAADPSGDRSADDALYAAVLAYAAGQTELALQHCLAAAAREPQRLLLQASCAFLQRSIAGTGTAVYDGTTLSATNADATFYLDPTAVTVNIDGQSVRRTTVETVNNPKAPGI